MLKQWFQRQFWTPAKLTLFIVIQFLVFQLTDVKMLGMGITLLALVQLLPVAWTHRQTLTRTANIQAAVAILLSLFVWWRADQLVSTLSLLLFVVLEWAFLHEAFTGQPVSLKSGWRFLGNWWHQFFFYTKTVSDGVGELLPKWPQKKFSLSWRPKHSIPFARIFLGVLVALPVFGMLLLLFATADDQFATILEKVYTNLISWIEHFFTLEWLFDQWYKVQDVVMGAVIFWLYFTAIFPIPGEKKQDEANAKSLFVEKATAALLIMVPFIAFIALQFHLLPTMFESFRTGAVNPALTIRESFAQLFLACAIGIGMVVFFLFEKTTTKNKYRALAVLTIGLLVEVFLVSLNAGYRLWIYQYLHGFTIYRIWGALMLGWLWATLVWALLPVKDTVSRNLRPSMFIYGLTSFAIVVLIAGLLNIHNLVMQNKPIVDEKVDWAYLERHISADGRREFTTALDQLKALREECQLSVANNGLVVSNAPASANCLRLVTELQPEYQTLQHFDKFVYKHLAQQFKYDRYDTWYYESENPRTRELIARDCQKVIDTPKPWWTRRGWDWHSTEICQGWLHDWAELRPAYQRLQEQVSSDSTATVRVLGINFTDGVIGMNSQYANESPPPYQMIDLANALEQASITRGSDLPLVDYQLVEVREKNKSELPISTYSYPPGDFARADRQYANVRQLFANEQICDLVDQDKVDEVWIWVPDMGPSEFGDSIGFRAYGVLSQNNPVWVGNLAVSETGFLDQSPAPCQQTVAFSMFNKNRGLNDHLQSITNRMYALAQWYNQPALTSFTANEAPKIDQPPTRFVDGKPVWACGSLSMPPNIIREQAGSNNDGAWYASSNTVLSDCDDWNVNRTGEVAEVSCSVWGCSQQGFFNWWLGSLTENMQLKVEDGSKPWPNLWRAAVR